MAQKQLLVQMDPDAGGDLDSVISALKTEGMTIDSVMKLSKTVAGQIDESAIAKVSNIKGVAHVREEGVFQLPPADKKIPQ